MKFLSSIVIFFCCLNGFAQIEIESNHHFQPSVVGEEFGILENTSDPDSGGVLTIFVANKSNTSDSIVSIVVLNSKGDTLGLKTWFYSWQKNLDAVTSVQNKNTVIIKSMLPDFSVGNRIQVHVATANGNIAIGNFLLREPKLKIANIIPNQSLDELWFYVRNDDTSDYQIQSLNINNISFSTNNSAVEMIGGDEVKPKHVAIIRFKNVKPLRALEPLFLKINVRAKSNGQSDTLLAFNRIVPAEFSFGTWDSPLFNANNEKGRKSLRQLNTVAVHGPGNPTLMQDAFDEYHMKTIWEPNLNGIENTVKSNENSDFVLYWSIDDEPDLNGKNIDTQLIKNNAFWNNDFNTPSYVNLCTQKKYQRYGWYADVVSMDHYTDNGAPNVIPLSWITRKGSPKEAIEYTEVLKRNTEPRRMRSWSQLAVKGTWKFQPEDYIINYQFWAHVMSGAKGIDFFCAKPSTPTDFPKQWNEAKRLVEQANPIKNLLLYAEPLNVVKTTHANDVEARLLVGRDYAVLILLNDSIDYTPVNIFNQEWRSDIWRKNFAVEVELPSWVSTQNIYEQTSAGKQNIQGLTSLGNRKFKISGEIFKSSRVFVFAPNDTKAPEAPQKIVFADVTAPNAYTVSWQEPHDNFGVKGYILKADGEEFATTLHPIFDASAAPNLCEIAYLEVIAFDEAGNMSPAAAATAPGYTGTGTASITKSPTDTTVNAGQQAIFSVADSGTGIRGYQWKVVDNGSVRNIFDNAVYAGTGTPTLTVNATQNENGKRYFCVVNTSCSKSVSSSQALLTVLGSVGIEEKIAAHIELKPNPNNGKFTLTTSHLNNFMVSVFDNRGALVSKIYTDGTAKADIDCSFLPSGIYSVVINQQNFSVTKRFLKQ